MSHAAWRGEAKRMRAPPALHVLLVLLIRNTRCSDMLRTWPLWLNGDSAGGFVGEKWGTNKVETTGSLVAEAIDTNLTLSGNNRIYAVDNLRFPPREWREVTYARLPLYNKELTFTVDMSGVNCGCGFCNALHKYPNTQFECAHRSPWPTLPRVLQMQRSSISRGHGRPERVRRRVLRHPGLRQWRRPSLHRD